MADDAYGWCQRRYSMSYRTRGHLQLHIRAMQVGRTFHGPDDTEKSSSTAAPGITAIFQFSMPTAARAP
jgi:hypothetical protein